MTKIPMEKVEFLSPEWIQLLRAIVIEGLAGVDLRGIEYSLCEVYKNVPTHLRRDGKPDIAFSVRIHAGKIEFGNTPLADATFSVVADHESMAPWVCLTHAETKERAGVEATVLMGQMIANGEMQVAGDLSARPACMVALNLHDQLAIRTKPPL
jgi:hypothetical protein